MFIVTEYAALMHIIILLRFEWEFTMVINCACYFRNMYVK